MMVLPMATISSRALVYRARPFLALVLYAQGKGSSKGHV